MAGEWIPIDCCLWEKLEVLRISKATGNSANEVVGNLARLWAWASHNVADGRIECGIDDLEMVVGADDAFWRAVVSVGWLIDNGDHMQIPGWEARFSQTAKSRLMANRRMKRHRDGHVTVDRHTSVAGCNGTALQGATVRRNQIEEIEEIEEKRGEETPSGDPSSSSIFDFWGDFKAQWAATAKTTGKGPKKPAKGFPEALDGHPGGWPAGYDRVLKALAMIPKCDYFESPVTMTQFFSDGFVERILDGHFSGRSRRRGKPPDDERPVRAFVGDDEKRFAATLERLRTEGRGK